MQRFANFDYCLTKPKSNVYKVAFSKKEMLKIEGIYQWGQPEPIHERPLIIEVDKNFECPLSYAFEIDHSFETERKSRSVEFIRKNIEQIPY